MSTVYYTEETLKEIIAQNGNQLPVKYLDALHGSSSITVYKSYLEIVSNPLEALQLLINFNYAKGPFLGLQAIEYSQLFLETSSKAIRLVIRGEIKSSEQLSQLHLLFGDFLSNFHPLLDTDTLITALKSLIDFANATSDSNISTRTYSTTLLLLATRKDSFALLQLLEKFVDMPSVAKGSLVYLLFKHAFSETYKEPIDLNTLIKYMLISKSAVNFFNAESDPESTSAAIKFLGSLNPPAETVVTYLAAAKQFGFEKDTQITPANAVLALYTHLTVEQLKQLVNK